MPKSHKYSNRSFSHSKAQVLNEPTVLTLQKDIDGYTRKVEVERRKLFTLDLTHQSVKKELEDLISTVNKLKKDQIIKFQKKDQAASRSLQLQIEQFNTKNCKMISIIDADKSNIDMLRRQRSQILEGMKQVEQELAHLDSNVYSSTTEAQKKERYAETTQQRMYMLKTKNEEEKTNYQVQFDQLKDEVLKERADKEKLSKTTKLKKQQFQTFDTGSLLKRRLQRVIANNKEKVKIIDTYQRNMRIIDEAFNQIKEATGLTDINEIKNNFIKSEEQNYALWTYVDVLNQEMDTLEDQNEELNERCKNQEIENVERQRILLATPDGERKRKNIQKIIDAKQQEINEFTNKLGTIQPIFEVLLKKCIHSNFNSDKTRQFTYQDGFQLTETNIDVYLAELENYIDSMVLFKSKKNLPKNYFVTNLLLNEIPQKEFKTKQQLQAINQFPTGLSDEIQEPNQLLKYDQLKDIALDLIDKRGGGSALQTQNFSTNKRTTNQSKN